MMSMSKLVFLLFGLFAIAAFVDLARAEDEPAEAVESQVPAPDADDFEDIDEDDEGLSGSPTKFGLHDVIDEGIPRQVKPRTGDCKTKKSEQECKICCADKGKGFNYEFNPSIKRLRQHTCTCFQRRVGSGN